MRHLENTIINICTKYFSKYDVRARLDIKYHIYAPFGSDVEVFYDDECIGKLCILDGKVTIEREGSEHFRKYIVRELCRKNIKIKKIKIPTNELKEKVNVHGH